MIDIFIPSYKRHDNNKTVKYFKKIGWDPSKLHVVIDDECGQIDLYEEQCKKDGVNLHIVSFEEAVRRFDFVHRPNPARRAAGMFRNLFHDIVREKGIDFFIVIDDDTINYQFRPFGVYKRRATFDDINTTFEAVKEFMQRQRIGVFGLSQGGDMFARYDTRLMRKKVMNTTFYDTRFIYAGEKGIQDDDTSQFAGIMNEGYFTGSLASGIVLVQTQSAKAKGGLTEAYEDLKLLSKAMICPIQFPSAIRGERQKMNGNRLHHRINYRYLMPCLIKGKRDNIAWDTYPEDVPFRNDRII